MFFLTVISIAVLLIMFIQLSLPSFGSVRHNAEFRFNRCKVLCHQNDCTSSGKICI